MNTLLASLFGWALYAHLLREINTYNGYLIESKIGLSS